MTRAGLATILIAAAASLAHADAKSLFADGQAAYKKQDYAAAAAKFSAAYDADPDPVYLYNAAQAYRLGRDCVRAADFYQRFFAKVPNPPNAEKIRGYADEMTTCAKAAAPPVPPAPRDPPPTDHPTEPAVGIVVAVPVPVPDQQRAGASYRDRAIGFAGLSVGAIGIGLGIAYAIGASHANRDHDAICPTGCMWDATHAADLKAVDDRGHRDQTISRVGFVVGGAALVAGAIFLFRDHHTEHVTVAPGADGGATLLGTFAF